MKKEIEKKRLDNEKLLNDLRKKQDEEKKKAD